MVLDNTGSFFQANNGNLITKVLGSVGLGLASEALRSSRTNKAIRSSSWANIWSFRPPCTPRPTSCTRAPTSTRAARRDQGKGAEQNIYAGRYTPVMSPYISATGFHANVSSTQYYLWGDPADVAAFGFASLDGQSGPIIEDRAALRRPARPGSAGYGDLWVAARSTRPARSSRRDLSRSKEKSGVERVVIRRHYNHFHHKPKNTKGSKS